MGTSLKVTPARAPLPSESYVPRAMPRVLTRWDLLASYTPALFLITNAVLYTEAGVVGLTYLLVGAIFFLVPCVIATLQLSMLYPHEGSLYNWTYHALGARVSFFVGLCYWLSGILVIVTADNAFVTILQGLNPQWLPQPWQQGAVMIGLLLVGVILATQRLRVAQNIIVAGAIFTVCGAVLVVLSCAIWLAEGHHSMTTFSHADAWTINPGNLAFLGIIVLSFIGASGPMNMAGEIREEDRSKKGIRFHLLWGTLLIFACYFLVTVALLVVRGAGIAQDANPSFTIIGVVDQVMGKSLGNVTAICVLFFCITATLLYTLLASRLLVAASIDQRLPKHLAFLNRNRVPTAAIWWHAGFAVVVVLFVFVGIPFVLPIGSQVATVFLTIISAALAVIWTIAALFYFVNLVVLWRREAGYFFACRVFNRPILVVTIFTGTVMCILSIVSIFIYPWLPPRSISGTDWRIAVGGVTLFCVFIALISTAIATDQADWGSTTE